MSTDLSDETNRIVSDSSIIKNSGDLSTNDESVSEELPPTSASVYALLTPRH